VLDAFRTRRGVALLRNMARIVSKNEL
jgi:hypothetical protein